MERAVASASGQGEPAEEQETAAVADSRVAAPATYHGVPSWELHYLIATFLSQGPCTQSASLLRQELAQHGLLPRRGHMGGQTAMSFDDVELRHARAFPAGGAAGHLPALVDRLFADRPQEHCTRFDTRRTLLGTSPPQ